MKKLLQFALLFGLVSALQAGFSSGQFYDDGLEPGDFGKPTGVNPIPGMGQDPTQFDDPVIVIDDEPSDEDEGLVYGENPRLHSTPWIVGRNLQH